jgi:SAM-dependent methyltransferase
MGLDGDLERWNARFSGEDYHFGTAPNAFLASQAARLVPGMTALCVSDGEGRNSVWLARQGLRVTAFDFSPPAVAKARRLAAEAGVTVEYHVGNINDWDWRARPYDLVVAIFIQFATPPERERIFDGFVEALAPGGLLILEGYAPRQIAYKTGGPPLVEHLYTTELLERAFRSLEILHLADYDAEIHEGTGHAGRSALVDLVARKPGPEA